MGLADAVQSELHIRLRVFSCVKCGTFWANLLYMLYCGRGVLYSIAVSFLCSYASLWIALLYDIAALYYNKYYEKITEADTADKGSEAPSDDVP